MTLAASNPHLAPPMGPASLLMGAWQHRVLIRRLTWREMVGRYRGSVVGVAWSFLHPLLMLAVYTFVFAVVFEAKWGGLGAGTSRLHFALVLFVGVIAHGVLAETLSKASALVLGNANLVKKVVFPLETLAFSLVGSALLHAAIGLTILLLAVFVFEGALPATALWLPMVILPLGLVALGVAWLLASLGVFLRDVHQITGVLSATLMFLAPVFYPLSALPESYRHWLYLNPVTFPIEQARVVLFAGEAPYYPGLALYYGLAFAFACLGYAWFQKTRRGFADVL